MESTFQRDIEEARELLRKGQPDAAVEILFDCSRKMQDHYGMHSRKCVECLYMYGIALLDSHRSAVESAQLEPDSCGEIEAAEQNKSELASDHEGLNNQASSVPNLEINNGAGLESSSSAQDSESSKNDYAISNSTTNEGQSLSCDTASESSNDVPEFFDTESDGDSDSEKSDSQTSNLDRGLQCFDIVCDILEPLLPLNRSESVCNDAVERISDFELRVFVSSLLRKAECLIELDDLSAADNILDKCLRVSPKNESFHRLISEVCFTAAENAANLGNLEKSFRLFDQCKEHLKARLEGLGISEGDVNVGEKEQLERWDIVDIISELDRKVSHLKTITRDEKSVSGSDEIQSESSRESKIKKGCRRCFEESENQTSHPFKSSKFD